MRVYGVGADSVQGDKAFAEVLGKMGAEVSYGPTWIEVTRNRLHGVDLDLNAIPRITSYNVCYTKLLRKGTTAFIYDNKSDSCPPVWLCTTGHRPRVIKSRGPVRPAGRRPPRRSPSRRY